MREYRYAAEEELDAYLDDAKNGDARAMELAKGTSLSADEARATLLAAGYFARAYNRMGLGRDEPATEDVEAGLEELEKLKVDNELTWWAWAFVHAKRERFAESASYLERLAASPHIDEAARKDLTAYAAEMKEGKGVLSQVKQARAVTILVQALVARVGGVENILTFLVGPEEARKILGPVTFLKRLRDGFAEAASPERVKERAKDLGGRLGETGKELGEKGLELLKKQAQPPAR